MPVTWFCIGFLVGMTLLIPFIVAALMERELKRLEGRIVERVVRDDGSVR